MGSKLAIAPAQDFPKLTLIFIEYQIDFRMAAQMEVSVKRKVSV